MHMSELEFGHLIEINNLLAEKILMVSKPFLDIYYLFSPIVVVPKQLTVLTAPLQGREKLLGLFCTS